MKNLSIFLIFLFFAGSAHANFFKSFTEGLGKAAKGTLDVLTQPVPQQRPQQTTTPTAPSASMAAASTAQAPMAPSASQAYPGPGSLAQGQSYQVDQRVTTEGLRDVKQHQQAATGILGAMFNAAVSAGRTQAQQTIENNPLYSGVVQTAQTIRDPQAAAKEFAQRSLQAYAMSDPTLAALYNSASIMAYSDNPEMMAKMIAVELLLSQAQIDPQSQQLVRDIAAGRANPQQAIGAAVGVVKRDIQEKLNAALQPRERVIAETAMASIVAYEQGQLTLVQAMALMEMYATVDPRVESSVAVLRAVMIFTQRPQDLNEIGKIMLEQTIVARLEASKREGNEAAGQALVGFQSYLADPMSTPAGVVIQLLQSAAASDPKLGYLVNVYTVYDGLKTGQMDPAMAMNQLTPYAQQDPILGRVVFYFKIYMIVHQGGVKGQAPGTTPAQPVPGGQSGVPGAPQMPPAGMPQNPQQPGAYPPPYGYYPPYGYPPQGPYGTPPAQGGQGQTPGQGAPYPSYPPYGYPPQTPYGAPPAQGAQGQTPATGVPGAPQTPSAGAPQSPQQPGAYPPPYGYYPPYGYPPQGPYGAPPAQGGQAPSTGAAPATPQAGQAPQGYYPPPPPYGYYPPYPPYGYPQQQPQAPQGQVGQPSPMPQQGAPASPPPPPAPAPAPVAQ